MVCNIELMRQMSASIDRFLPDEREWETRAGWKHDIRWKFAQKERENPGEIPRKLLDHVECVYILINGNSKRQRRKHFWRLLERNLQLFLCHCVVVVAIVATQHFPLSDESIWCLCVCAAENRFLRQKTKTKRQRVRSFDVESDKVFDNTEQRSTSILINLPSSVDR